MYRVELKAIFFLIATPPLKFDRFLMYRVELKGIPHCFFIAKADLSLIYRVELKESYSQSQHQH